MEIKADLHSHTVASDGSCQPAENVRIAKEQGLAALAITDHDTVAGVAEAIEAGKELGIEVIPGVEISTAAKGQDIHVLGYFVPYDQESFREKLTGLRDVRHQRNIQLIKRLNELGVEITLEDVYRRKTGPDKNIGRPHIAEELMEKGYVESVAEAFDKYLGKTGSAYVNVERISPQQAIDLIKKSGGAAVLAHPGLYDDDELVEELIVYGLDGIEAYHPDNSPEQVKEYERLADEYGLIRTGGSDFHGYRGPEPFHAMLGSYTAPLDTVAKLRKLTEMRKAKL
ncbi:PHP domain-containing protein [Brevibacillus dissolubilis]|uniref:PHP domain-containing protein n=1 Tax=Brevibacillus dissolubilis TaxID=1844116 RepID=UPI00111699F3|nr:PHP domain-containing protein [Brevibacillus dissolubilis]